MFEALTPLGDADLQRSVVIRGESMSVYKAISRQVAHYAGHAYQILFLAKHLQGAELEDVVDPARPIGRVQPPHAREAEGGIVTGTDFAAAVSVSVSANRRWREAKFLP